MSLRPSFLVNHWLKPQLPMVAGQVNKTCWQRDDDTLWASVQVLCWACVPFLHPRSQF